MNIKNLETHTKYGFRLELLKVSERMLNLSLYDNKNILIDSKGFLLTSKKDLELLKRYIKYFKENPKQNKQKMLKIIPEHRE